MTRAVTTPERLTRIETLLEQAVVQRAEERAAMKETIDEMAANIKAIKADVEDVKAEVSADKADLAALKNKGAGILIGVGLAGGAIGAGINHVLEMFK